MAIDAPAAAPDEKASKGLWGWLEKHLAASALLAVVAGGIFGVVLDRIVDGLVGAVSGGPTLEKLMDEQKTSFASMQESLAALRSAAPSADLRDLIGKLQQEMGSQEEFSKRYQTELRAYVQEVAQLRQQLRTEKGFSGGADFWLGAGESVRLAGEANVLGVLYAHRSYSTVNFNGERRNMVVGDAVDFSTGDETCKAIYRQIPRQADRRVGFDVICADKAQAAG